MSKVVLRAARRWATETTQKSPPKSPASPPMVDGYQRFYHTEGTNIASEAPMFGKHGYKPLDMPSESHYALTDNFAFVTTTNKKALRLPGQNKKILPPPATKVAIFGATSYQGTRIAKRLLEAPEILEVRMCTRYPDQIPADLQKLIDENPDKCTVEETNVLQQSSVNRALQGCDAVINAIDLRVEDFYNTHYDVHVHGNQNVAYQARLCGIKRVVYISGLDAIYGNDSDYSDFRCKSEDLLLAECFFGVVVRPGKLFGSGYRYSTVGKVCYPTVYPNTKLQPTWVNDLAEAVFRIVRNPEAVKRVVDLGGPKVMTHMQFAAERANHMKGPSPVPVPLMAADIFSFFLEWFTPRPQFSRNLICEMEQHQVARTKTENPYIWTYEDLGITPVDMKTAAKREAEGEAF